MHRGHRSWRSPLALLAPALFASALGAASASAQDMHVEPYLQDVTPTSAWIVWETTEGAESRVEWGASDALGQSATGTDSPSEGAHRMHEVQLTNLTPGTRYHYQAHTGSASSTAASFTTAPDRGTSVTFRLAAMSDMQIDRANPQVFGEIVSEGILSVLAEEGLGAPDEALGFVLVPGDLVDDGLEYEPWRTEFFEPAAPLMSLVPFYPTLGNHENNSDLYFRYFHLPDNGSADHVDRWWSMDWANVRVLGLDSNQGLLVGQQEAFFEARLTEACADEQTDFVFVNLHHPHRSELWPVGEGRFATQVVERMNRFSAECGKPSANFYGHTHGYSRGASRDASHLWINVATAGGNIDYWDEYTQRDYDEVSVSQDEYGFVLIEVSGGDSPSFHLRRFGRGDDTAAEDNVLRDEITIRRDNASPPRPSAEMPRGRVAPACNTLLASEFTDPDGDEHGATHWQVGTSCDGFEVPAFERYRTFENWYGEVDTQADDDLRDEALEGLEPNTYYCWRVRYRDRGLAWSEWSEPVAFLIDPAGATVAEGCADATTLTPPVPDAGTEPPHMGGGCGCAAIDPHSSLGLWAWMGVLIAWVRRR